MAKTVNEMADTFGFEPVHVYETAPTIQYASYGNFPVDNDGYAGFAKFKYVTTKGKMTAIFKGLDLSALTGDEAHLGLTLQVGGKLYFTSVTFFQTKPGSWTTKSAR